ncbi:hypothetical protein BDQ17DRAFT_1353336 [Cyathus striatus]|nr:hypothetical protein BDQ17DRAFT_1353336 [Cyathus striatus]
MPSLGLFSISIYIGLHMTACHHTAIVQTSPPSSPSSLLTASTPFSDPCPVLRIERSEHFTFFTTHSLSTHTVFSVIYPRGFRIIAFH